VENEDIDLIKEYLNGNQESFRLLINRYLPLIYNFAARFTINDASDISQDVFIKVWKNIKNFDSSKASFKTWIFQIARNTIIDHLRKKKSIVFSDLEDKDDSWIENVSDNAILQDEIAQKLEDKEFLNKLLDKISPLYREVLVLYYQEDMTFNEIGIVLNKPLNTVKSHHYRAIIELRKMINDNFAPNIIK
jgi:RNA polymerase sigma-70 factor, ECF subfamily